MGSPSTQTTSSYAKASKTTRSYQALPGQQSHYTAIEHQPVLLFVDVKLGPRPCDIVRLELREGEDVGEVATRFCIEYSLDEGKRSMMEALLRERVL